MISGPLLQNDETGSMYGGQTTASEYGHAPGSEYGGHAPGSDYGGHPGMMMHGTPAADGKHPMAYTTSSPDPHNLADGETEEFV